MEKLNKLADEIVARLVDCGSADDEPVEQYKEWTRKKIAEAFRALEQRTEAAERERDETVMLRLEVSDSLSSATIRYEKAEAKLAELEKQDPVAYTDAEEIETMLDEGYAEMFAPRDAYKSDPQWIPLFTRPAPAARLAELVPSRKSPADFVDESFSNRDLAAIWNSCVSEMQRNIEGAK